MSEKESPHVSKAHGKTTASAHFSDDATASPKKKPRHDEPAKVEEAVKTTAVESGVVVKKVSYQWSLKNFDLIRSTDELLKKQTFEFQVTDSFGAQTSWLINLRNFVDPIDKAEWVAIRRQLVKSSLPTSPNARSSNSRARVVSAVDPVCNILTITVNDKNGKCYLKSGGKTSYTKTNAFGFTKLFRKSEKTDSLPLINGSLVINIDLEIISNLPTSIETSNYHFDVKSFESGCKLRICGMLASLEGDTSRSDVKIVSNDGIEFPAHRLILAATSPVFEAMFRSIMTETETGIMKCDDLSAKCIKILIHFIYTGALLDEWRDCDVLYELTYAADKYLLTDLLKFLDGILGKVCSPSGIGNLLSLAKNLGLKRAEKDIRDFIKTCAGSSPEELVCGS